MLCYLLLPLLITHLVASVVVLLMYYGVVVFTIDIQRELPDLCHFKGGILLDL